MVTKLIFVKAGRKAAYLRKHLSEFAEALYRDGIEVVKVCYYKLYIYTPNVTIRFLTSDMNWRGLRCDEAFGFNQDTATYFRFDHSSESYPGTIIQYIKEQEAKANE